uniref:Uncharacterized protein n=1 Tax=Candidatus Kentrum sp. UNK TaxID=2126344 RepID=A0A451AQ54_9GAMM|nr:MAG: hypothetical protein BECKUNK1418G_GA0071005_12119 [Candidatus Kentron sp. UNK]VFK73008.1 MAG: hypothetical protein BECKUNK1418H_GA0071006_115613 [Candidatus Kentron sp. UNK]
MSTSKPKSAKAGGHHFGAAAVLTDLGDHHARAAAFLSPEQLDHGANLSAMAISLFSNELTVSPSENSSLRSHAFLRKNSLTSLSR